eukprot:1568287-Lingulodinium_polyedra.AAC.1
MLQLGAPQILPLHNSPSAPGAPRTSPLVNAKENWHCACSLPTAPRAAFPTGGCFVPPPPAFMVGGCAPT